MDAVKVEEIMKTKVRPKLAEHLGDIEVLKVENGIVEVRLLGACSKCPSGKITMEEIVESALKAELPEVERVILVNDVSDELWQVAKSFLKKER